jgi:hypothetical protein
METENALVCLQDPATELVCNHKSPGRIMALYL